MVEVWKGVHEGGEKDDHLQGDHDSGGDGFSYTYI